MANDVQYTKMENKQRGIHFPASGLSLLIITLFAIPAIQPVLQRTLACGFDTVFHLWRAVQMEELLQQGVWFSRWAPHMAHGYGYPLYLFQSPLSAYLVALLNWVGLAWPVAINVVYGAAILASGWTMWLLARELWGEKGAVVTAVAYLYAPFHAYVSFYRGSLSETTAWALVPLVLWGLHRWQMRQRKVGLATAVLAFIALIFTHDVTAYAFFPFFVGWAAALALTQRSWPSLGRGLLALTLGVGGSAFFWLPAIMERHLIQFSRANSAWPFLYFNNFLPIEQLLALPRNADPAFMNDWPERGLGALLAFLAVGGAFVAWRHLPRQRWLTAYLALALAGYVLLTGVASRPLWDTFSLLQTFQFPWRFLAPATFAAALLTGGWLSPNSKQLSVIGNQLSDDRPPITDYRLLITVFLLALLSIAHWGWFYPQQCPAPSDLTLAGMVAWEEGTDTIGTTASRELLPVTVSQFPQDATNLPVWESRLSPAELPEGATILQETYTPLRTEVEIETAVPFTARFRTLFFPGWRAWLDGEAVDIQPSVPEGLITVNVPDGRHTVVVAFGETPLRWLADIISLLSLAALGLLLWRWPSAPPSEPPPEPPPAVPPDRHWLWAALILSLVLLAGAWLLSNQYYPPMRQIKLIGGELAGVANPTNLTFGDPANPAQVRLLGYEDWDTAVPAEHALAVTLFWQALVPLDKEYRVGLTLTDAQGLRWSSEDLRDNRWTRSAPPTQTWPLDQYAQTAFYVDMLPGIPSGSYTLNLSLFEKDSLTPLTIYQNGQPIGPDIPLGTVEIEPPQQPTTTAALPPEAEMLITTPERSLWGLMDRTEAAPGSDVKATLFWEMAADSTLNEDTAVTLSLTDADATVVQSWSIPLPAYGTGVWQTQQLLRLPVSLDDGSYTWQVILPPGQSASFSDPLTIDAPERLFEPVEMATAVNSSFSLNGQNQAALVGFSTKNENCVQPTAGCTVELLWLAESEMTESYRVFVQWLGPDGHVVSQSDGIPAQASRPTTGWLPGEYILDTHHLAFGEQLLPGTYTLIVGLVQEDTRLKTEDGRDFLTLDTYARPSE